MQHHLRWSARVHCALIFMCVLSLMLGMPALTHAGGWAVITLDAEPLNVRPDQPFTIGFVVRQHGVTPINGLDPSVTAMSSAGEKVEVRAQQEGAVGHYVATMKLPAGTWTWQIDAFFPIAQMGTLEVRNALPQARATRLLEPSMTWWLWLAGTALIVLGGITTRQQRRAMA